MQAFREKTPQHRKNRKVCKNYSSYKKTLRVDFNQRCAYCNDIDTNRIRSYVIDHFVPRTPDGWICTIPENKYVNLMYACPSCNGAKSNKWPTKNQALSNDGKQGFIKPTLKNFEKLFRRDTDGSIAVHKGNVLGKYIHKELAFDLAIHALNWKFEKFLAQEKILIKLDNNGNDPGIQADLATVRLARLEIVDIINAQYNG